MRLPRCLIKRMQSILSFLNWLNYSFRFSNAFKRRPRKMILICERKIVENVLRWTGKKNGRIKKWTKLLNVFFGSNHCRWTVKISKKNISPRHKNFNLFLLIVLWFWKKPKFNSYSIFFCHVVFFSHYETISALSHKSMV